MGGERDGAGQLPAADVLRHRRAPAYVVVVAVVERRPEDIVFGPERERVALEGVLARPLARENDPHDNRADHDEPAEDGPGNGAGVVRVPIGRNVSFAEMEQGSDD